MAALHALDARVEVALDAALLELLDGVDAEPRAHLGHDPAGGLDQHPVHVGLLEALVVPQRVAGHVLQLRQRLDAREAAADDDEAQQPLAQLRVVRAGGLVEPRQHVVAQVDGLADGLHADADLGQARDGQRARDGAERRDEHVVLVLLDVTVGELDRDGLALVLDAGGAAGDHVAALEDLAQGHHDVAGLDGTGRRLGEERLVGHVRLGVDHRDGRLAGTQLLLQSQRGVHADVPTADNHDPCGLRLHSSHTHMVAPGGAFRRIERARCDHSRRVIADTLPLTSGSR